MTAATHAGLRTRITARDGTRVVGTVLLLELPILAGLKWGASIGVMLVLALSPFGLFALMHLRRDVPGLPVLPGLFVSGGFGVFFSAGVLAWALGDRGSAIGYASPRDGTFATEMMLSLAAMTAAFVVGERLLWRPQRRVQVSPSVSPLVTFGHLLFLLSATGVVLTVDRLGGWSAAASLLSTHNKEDWAIASGSLGLSLWAVFSVPAMVAQGICAFSPRVSRRGRVVAATELAVILTVAITLFGSRLLVTLAAVGIIGGSFALTGARLRMRVVAAGLAAFLAVSAVVLSSRPADRAQVTGLVHSQLLTLGYSIYDVSLAAWTDRERVGPLFRDGDRAGRVLLSIVPGVGPRGATITDDRLDVITVRAVGRARNANTTGLPPSLPTYLLVAYGQLLPIAFSFIAGLLVGAVTAFLLARRSSFSAFFVGLWFAFVFNDFKGGDVLVDLTAEVRRWGYLAVLIAVVSVVHGIRGNRAAS